MCEREKIVTFLCELCMFYFWAKIDNFFPSEFTCSFFLLPLLMGAKRILEISNFMYLYMNTRRQHKGVMVNLGET